MLTSDRTGCEFSYNERPKSVRIGDANIPSELRRYSDLPALCSFVKGYDGYSNSVVFTTDEIGVNISGVQTGVVMFPAGYAPILLCGIRINGGVRALVDSIVDDSQLSRLLSLPWDAIQSYSLIERSGEEVLRFADKLKPKRQEKPVSMTTPDQKTRPAEAAPAKTGEATIASWNASVFASAKEGVRDGAALTAADALTEAGLRAIKRSFPGTRVFIEYIEKDDFLRSVSLIVVPWGVGAMTHIFPDIFPGDPELLRKFCARAIRGVFTTRFASVADALHKGLKEVANEFDLQDEDKK